MNVLVLQHIGIETPGILSDALIVMGARFLYRPSLAWRCFRSPARRGCARLFQSHAAPGLPLRPQRLRLPLPHGGHPADTPGMDSDILSGIKTGRAGQPALHQIGHAVFHRWAQFT